MTRITEKSRSLLELGILLAAVTFTASSTASVQGNNIGKQEAVRTGKGALAGVGTAAVLAAYKLYRGKD